MSVKLLTGHHLEFLTLKQFCTGSSGSTLVKVPHCVESHVEAHLFKLLYFIFSDALKLNIKEESGQEGMSGYIKSEAESETGEETPGSCKELGRSLRFVCHYCGQMFKNKQYREFHEKLHLAKFPYVCQSCGEGFNEEQSYEEHGKVHITNPLLNCESCGYRTTRKFRMNSHREICRKPSKVFLCPYCQKPFLAKRYMKVHMKSHDLSNVHHCPYCVNTYPLKNSLLKHIRTKHKIY